MDVRTAPSERSISDLGDDLMMNILSRLPSKPQGICRCVSKPWRHLVFTLTHSPTRPRPTNRFVIDAHDLRWGFNESTDPFPRTENEVIAKDSLTFLPCYPDTRIVEGRDGFLLCYGPSMGTRYHYFVCNPITRQWVALPHPPEYRRRGIIDENLALILDKTSDFYHSHYKVVRFVTDYERDLTFHCSVRSSAQFHVDAYSSHTGKWTESKSSLKHSKFVLLSRPSVILDGVLFLLTSPCLLMYDVKEDFCKGLDLPRTEFSLSHCLGESKGHLNYACQIGLRIEVWMLEGSEWMLKHKISLVDMGYSVVKPLEIITFHPTLDTIFIMDLNEMFCYDVNSKALERIMSLHPSALADFLIQVLPFSECICPLAGAQ